MPDRVELFNFHRSPPSPKGVVQNEVDAWIDEKEGALDNFDIVSARPAYWYARRRIRPRRKGIVGCLVVHYRYDD